MTGRAFLAHEGGAAAVEMAMLLPLVLALLFGGLEAGYYFWNEHKVIEAVRNGARYASRLSINEVCPSASSTTIANVSLLTRTGQLANSSAASVVPGWSSNSQVRVTFNCGAFVSTGIYTTLGGNGPTVKVEAQNLAYPSLFGALGFIDSSARLYASASTAVIGI